MDPALTGLLALIKEGGPYALTAYVIVQWWLERKERLQLQADKDALTQRAVDAINNAAGSIKDFRLLSRIDRGRRGEE